MHKNLFNLKGKESAMQKKHNRPPLKTRNVCMLSPKKEKEISQDLFGVNSQFVSEYLQQQGWK